MKEDILKDVLGSCSISKAIDELDEKERLLLEARLVGFRELPPTFEEFLCDDYYIGQSTDNGNAIYPKWREFCNELFPDEIHTTNNVVALGGAIGIGKSRVGRLIMGYDYCKLTYLDTLSYGGLDNDKSGKSIDLLFGHKTNGKAWEELIDPFYKMCEKSAYFSKNILNDYRTRFLDDGPLTQKGIGKDILSFMISEANFWPQQKVIDKVNELTSRCTSRFLKYLPYITHIILDSSANDDGSSFIDDYLTKTTWDVKTARFTTWEMKDFLNMYFKEGSFRVYAGDTIHEPFVIDNDSQIVETMDMDKIIVCPKELEKEFRADCKLALKDKAGITTSSTGLFITNKAKLRESFVLAQPVEEVIVDFYDEGDTLFSKVKSIINDIPREKRLYIGIDLGLVSDRTGFSIAYFDDYVKVGSGWEPKIKVPLALAISRLPGQETSIHKIKELIFAINNIRDISMVCMDQYQSSQLRQDCKLAKIKAVLSSVDRTYEPYNYLKRAIYLGTIELPKSKVLQEELARLMDTGKKVDHPNDGSKDTADSVCNAVYNLFQDLEHADKISGRFHTQAQVNMLDQMGFFGDDEKDRVLADIMIRARNA